MREHVMRRLRTCALALLIATDVAARVSIDIEARKAVELPLALAGILCDVHKMPHLLLTANCTWLCVGPRTSR
jgi:hypothetical protein